MANNVSIKVSANTAEANKKLLQAGASVSLMANKAKAALKNLNEFNKSANSATSAIQNMGAALSSGNFTGFIGSLSSAQGGISGLIGCLKQGEIASLGFGTALKAALGPVGLITAAVAAVGGIAIKAGKDFSEFELKTAELKSLTGLSDDVLNPLQDKIIATSKEFKSSAPEIVESMKNIGSARPELLGDADALLQVTKSANVLAEAGLMSVDEAASGLTTVLNQMNISATESDNIINSLAKALQAGSVSIQGIKTAFEKSGTAAAMAGMSYQDLIASIETIGPKFGSVDVLGTHLSGTIMALSTQANNEFNPAIVGLDKALENLANANLSTAEKAKLFGRANIDAANALIEGRDSLKQMRSEITGTNSAYEQMAINTDTMSGAIDKLKSSIAASFLEVGKAMNEGNGLSDMVKDFTKWINSLSDILFDAVKRVIELFKQFSLLTVVQVIIESIKYSLEVLKLGISAVIDIIMEIASAFMDVFQTSDKGFKDSINLSEIFASALEVVRKALSFIVDIIRVILKVWSETVKSIINIWNQFVSYIKDSPLGNFITNIFNQVYEAFKKVIGKLIELWNKFKEFIGLDTTAKFKVETKTDNKSNNSQSTSTPSSINAETTTTSTPSAKVKAKVIPDKGSIKDLETKLSKLNDELNNKNVSDSRLKEIKKEKSEIEKQIESLKKRNGLLDNKNYSEGSLQDIQSKISSFETLIKTGVYLDGNDLQKCQSEIKRYKELQEKEEIRLGLKVVPAPGSILDIQDKISKLDNQIKTGIYLEGYDLEKCQSELKEWKKRLEQEEIRVGVKIDTDKNVSIKLPKVDPNKVIEKGSNEDKLKSLDNANQIASNAQKLVYEGIIKPDEGKKIIDDLNKQLKELGLLPISLVLDTREAQEKLEKTKETISGVKDITSATGNVFGNLGSAIGGTAGEMMNFAGLAISATGEVIALVMTMIAAKNAEAIATGTASASAMPFPANIAAIASIVATIASVFASLPTFASGGIMSSTTIGDNTLARINPNEMILNQRQQHNLFRALDSGSPGTVSKSSDVNFRISGSNLVGSLKNYQKKMNKLR